MKERPKRAEKPNGWSKLRMLAIILLCGVLLVSGFNLIRELLDYRQGEETYGEAEKLVDLPDFDLLPTPVITPAVLPSLSTSPTPTEGPDPAESEEPGPEESVEPTPTPTPYVDPYADALSAMDFTALQEVNSDVIGWIIIPGTTVSYPLLQTDNNTYYLSHTWKGKRSSVGSIFLECQSDPELTDFHTIVYGHNMRNGSMFGALQSYRNQSHVDAHPSVYLTVDSGTYRYDIFAVYQADVDSNTYQIGFSGEKSRQTFLDDCMSRSLVTTGVTPHTYDRILTLSTCTNIGGKAIRWVVQATCPGEEPAVEETPQPEETPGEEGAYIPEASAPAEESPAPEETAIPSPGIGEG